MVYYISKFVVYYISKFVDLFNFKKINFFSQYRVGLIRKLNIFIVLFIFSVFVFIKVNFHPYEEKEVS